VLACLVQTLQGAIRNAENIAMIATADCEWAQTRILIAKAHLKVHEEVLQLIDDLQQRLDRLEKQ